MISRRALLAAGALATADVRGAVLAQTQARKPKVPSGRDPGGVAVALIGSGVDYTQPQLVPRLARDGEGDLVGWDTIDKDAVPFERPPGGGLADVPDAGTEMAAILLSAARTSRLVPTRTSDQNLPAIAEALAFVSRTPTPIAVLLTRPGPADAPEQLQGLIAALPRLFVVMPVIERMMLTAPNLIVVAAADRDGRALAGEAEAGAEIDVALSLELGAQSSDTPRRTRHLAAVRLGALAAEVLVRDRPTDAAALKTRLLARAKPPAGPDTLKTRFGLLAQLSP